MSSSPSRPPRSPAGAPGPSDSSAAGPGFGELLRRYRLVAGVTQQELSERAGISLRAISDLERGVRRAPYPATVRRLADALRLSAEARAALAAAGRRGAAAPEAPPAAAPSPSAPPPAAGGPLPAPLTSFVGRDWELGEVQRLLAGEPATSGGWTRLLSLTGPGGIGKTRLALAAARAAAAAGGAVAFAALAPLESPELVPQAVAVALGVREEPGFPLTAALAAAVGERRLLLVLDNCEHLLDACAVLAEGLLSACPRLQVIATSREPLGVAGEVVWRVPSLRLPDPADGARVGRLADVEAVRLFVERARAVVPGFALDGSNAAAVAEVCRRLDGIPLALELAAARVRALAVEQIAARLDDRFRLLVGGSRTALPRHRTLAATLDWSYQLLAPAERALLRRLTVFAGGWTLDAAEAVGADAPEGAGAREGPPGPVGALAVIDLLTGLVDKSLVLAETQAGGSEERYRLLETVRRYGAERLGEAGETAAARARHLAWTVGWAERTAPLLIGHHQVRWLRRMALEHDNFRSALEWSRAAGDAASELRLAGALGRFWHLNGPSSEGRFWLRHALEHSPPAPSAARALALNWAGRLATVNGDADDRQLLEESVAMARVAGDLRLLALAERHLSMAAQRQGDAAAARAALQAALETARRAGDRREEAFDLVSLGAAAEQAGDTPAAARLLGEGLALGRTVGDAGPIGWALSVLGAIAAAEGRAGEAVQRFEEALEFSRPIGYWAVTVAALAQLGTLEQARGNLDAARARGRECIGAAREIGDRGLVAAALAFFGDLELQAGRDERGIRLLGAESAWRPVPGAGRFVSFWSWPAPRVEDARARMGEAAYARAWAAGQALTLEAAVAEALEDGPPTPAPPPPGGLLAALEAAR
ncbi:MAG TPA: tetratricopeptide repeat protein [Chloroflexota bacterium]|nr:tetratricopeptide repeat protein [Chloroflexota bacterium]